MKLKETIELLSITTPVNPYWTSPYHYFRSFKHHTYASHSVAQSLINLEKIHLHISFVSILDFKKSKILINGK